MKALIIPASRPVRTELACHRDLTKAMVQEPFGLNPYDCHMLRRDPLIARLMEEWG
jgi:hypothetical protein